MSKLATAVFAAQSARTCSTHREARGSPSSCADSTRPRIAVSSPAVVLQWISRGDAAFPSRLRSIHDPPPGLFVRGAAPLTLLGEPSVAVVGARACFGYGSAVAASLGRELAAAGPSSCRGWRAVSMRPPTAAPSRPAGPWQCSVAASTATTRGHTRASPSGSRNGPDRLRVRTRCRTRAVALPGAQPDRGGAVPRHGRRRGARAKLGRRSRPTSRWTRGERCSRSRGDHLPALQGNERAPANRCDSCHLRRRRARRDRDRAAPAAGAAGARWSGRPCPRGDRRCAGACRRADPPHRAHSRGARGGARRAGAARSRCAIRRILRFVEDRVTVWISLSSWLIWIGSSSPEAISPSSRSMQSSTRPIRRCGVGVELMERSDRAGGPTILAECVRTRRVPDGRGEEQRRGRLAARHVIHTVGPIWRDGDQREVDLPGRATELTGAHRRARGEASPSRRFSRHRFHSTARRRSPFPLRGHAVGLRRSKCPYVLFRPGPRSPPSARPSRLRRSSRPFDGVDGDHRAACSDGRSLRDFADELRGYAYPAHVPKARARLSGDTDAPPFRLFCSTIRTGAPAGD